MNIPDLTRTSRLGLFAIIESRRVALPLKGVECDFTIRGGVAEVCMTHIYRQENHAPFDCEYLFPLPADASVYFCEADINGKVISAMVKERQEARNLVHEKKTSGFRTVLVESERDNLFTLGLGNVQPGDVIIIRLKYFQTIRALDQTYSIEIPFCPGVRYIPGNPLLRANKGKGVIDDTDEVPDASRISPPRIDAWHPDAAYVDVRGRLDAEYAGLRTLASPSHSIKVSSLKEELTVTLSRKSEVPDRDFVLRWQEIQAKRIAPRAWTYQKNGETYALLEIRAPRQAQVRQTAIDFYFLVDRSGSMGGQKWLKAVEALQSCVRVLGPDDRAMITLFENFYRDFAEEPLPVAQVVGDPSFHGLHQMGAGGGTNLAPALQHVLEVAANKSKDRVKNLILITDAQIGNESAILDLMRPADMAVHCFGIDIALNDALLLALTRQQGGTFHSLNPSDNIQAEVTKLGKTLREPVLFDLNLPAAWEPADAKIPDLYAGQTLYLSARASGKKALKLTARSAAGKRVSLDFQAHPVSQSSPSLLWHKTRIQRCLAEGRNQDAIALSVASNLLCRLTAFVAWDESEKVMVSRHELVQPAMELSGNVGLHTGSFTCHMVNPALRGARERDTKRFMQNPNVRRLHPPGRFDQVAGILRDDSVVARVFITNLQTACGKLGGDDWKESVEMIAHWITAATGNEIEQRIDAIDKCIVRLNIYAGLKATLEAPGDKDQFLKYFSTYRVQVRNLPGLWDMAGNELKEMESIFQLIEKVNESTTQEQFESLARQIRQKAIEMLKRFAGLAQSKTPEIVP
ncbi:MAG TPA: VIT and VWA domain-containing protein [Pseudomonadales bacterium]|nr:VIT and VWA domain-containing protein [Pseudomonadales bacterium]